MRRLEFEKIMGMLQIFQNMMTCAGNICSQFESVDSVDVGNLKVQNQKKLDHEKDANFLLCGRTR
jgi:hypothetical protein